MAQPSELLVKEFLEAAETHSAERLAAVIAAGFDSTVPIHGKLPIDCLIEMYFRSDRFPACLRELLTHGARLDDPSLLAVLLDDVTALQRLHRDDPSVLSRRVTRVSTFTPLVGVSLLHVAAEFGNTAMARALIALGADVEDKAALDEYGLGGHTPLFHVVNSNDNRSLPILEALLAAGARPDVRIAGLVWGRGFDWETTLFDLTPISYAQYGLLPQMHRKERDIHDNVRRLLAAAGRPLPPSSNLPNRYLRPRS